MVSFPFQTPTNLTYAMLRATGDEARLKIMVDTLTEWGWDAEDISRYHDEVKALMESPSLELSLI